MTDKDKSQHPSVPEYVKKSLSPNKAVNAPKERPIAPDQTSKVTQPKK